MTKPETRNALQTRLEAAGVDGAAAALVLDVTAAARHAWRVGEAQAAAIKFASRPQWAGYRDLVAATLLAAELFGVGGSAGITGDATDRLPAFAGLGKGRKQASDGPAWSAAIAEAAVRLGMQTGMLTFRAIGSLLGVECEDAGPITIGNMLPLDWQRTIAAYGLLATTTGQRPRVSVLFCDAAEEWAKTFNRICQEMADGHSLAKAGQETEQKTAQETSYW